MDVPDTEHESKDKVESVASGGRGLEESDADLDQLLDCKFKLCCYGYVIYSLASLNEFGKHVPAKSVGGNFPPLPIGRNISRVDDVEDPSLKELEKVFGEEFAAQVN